MSTFQTFEMERMMSLFEQDVEYNLSESGVHPILLRELLDDHPDYTEYFLGSDLNYPHVNGIPELRQNIANLYQGAMPKNVLVTVGAAEANYITTRTLLNRGDEIVVMLPNYMQIWGIAKNHGLHVKTFRLSEENGWAPDLDELRDQVTDQTRLIAVCNPNNPTGRIMTEAEMDAIVEIADGVGAWILADEVYSGAERLTDKQTPSFFGRYGKVVANGSMSKAYGMPGLRIGWAVAPTAVVDDIWARHEYTTISATMLANKLATIALSAEVRPRILARTRSYIRQGYTILEEWMDGHPDTFDLTPPGAAAIAFIRYHLNINSAEFAARLRGEKSVLIVPGDHFGMDHFLRISFGLPRGYLVPALDRIHDLIVELS
ncbi:MAG: aminotransferase class I/II-fold pyridoxal phosphate-dependent enzyme [Chloroflexi bacterium]|nr:aminotransferase class I/II-fold pyridoxal phosphate-dependent enzyme [Chloroflexota bacterium]